MRVDKVEQGARSKDKGFASADIDAFDQACRTWMRLPPEAMCCEEAAVGLSLRCCYRDLPFLLCRRCRGMGRFLRLLQAFFKHFLPGALEGPSSSAPALQTRLVWACPFSFSCVPGPHGRTKVSRPMTEPIATHSESSILCTILFNSAKRGYSGRG